MTIAVSPPCKICGGGTSDAGAVDFNKTCNNAVAGPGDADVSIAYHRCETCGFLFTCALDGWSQADFLREIYNAAYHLADPDYEAIRPLRNADIVEQLFGRARSDLRLLDYGGGNGALARALRRRGFDAATYDPFDSRHDFVTRPGFDLITCFETMEHLPDPPRVIRHMLTLMKPSGAVLFSTRLLPADAGLDDWYVAPRNGHVSIFTKRALTQTWAVHGCNLVCSDKGWHMAFRQIPAFASHLVAAAA